MGPLYIFCGCTPMRRVISAYQYQCQYQQPCTGGVCMWNITLKLFQIISAAEIISKLLFRRHWTCWKIFPSCSIVSLRDNFRQNYFSRTSTKAEISITHQSLYLSDTTLKTQLQQTEFRTGQTGHEVHIYTCPTNKIYISMSICY